MIRFNYRFDPFELIQLNLLNTIIIMPLNEDQYLLLDSLKKMLELKIVIYYLKLVVYGSRSFLTYRFEEKKKYIKLMISCFLNFLIFWSILLCASSPNLIFFIDL